MIGSFVGAAYASSVVGPGNITGAASDMFKSYSSISQGLGMSKLELLGKSSMTPYLYSGNSLSNISSEPNYLYDPGYVQARTERMIQSANDAPGKAFGGIVKAGLFLNTIPKLGRIITGEKGVKNITPIGMRNMLFGGSKFMAGMGGFGLGSAMFGSPVAGVVTGGLFAKFAGGSKILGIGGNGAGMAGLFGQSREGMSDAIKQTFGMDDVKGPRVKAITNIERVSDITAESFYDKATAKKVGSKFYQVRDPSLRPGLISSMSTADYATRLRYDRNIDILDQAYSGKTIKRTINLQDVSADKLDVLNKLNANVKGYNKLSPKLFEKAFKDINKAAFGGSSFLSRNLGFFGMPFSEIGFLFKMATGSYEKGIALARDKAANTIDDRLSGIGSKINKRKRILDNLTEDISSPNYIYGQKVYDGGKYTAKTKVTGLKSMSRESIEESLDSRSIGSLTARRSALFLGRIMKYKYITGVAKQELGKVTSGVIGSIKEAVTMTKNIGRMEFGSGKTLETQVASNERSRAISAMQNVGISARSYLGQEANIMAQ
jgi:hypothetical protein